ncbi:MAG: hypothetical protein ACXV5Q_07405 [Frankiaceae bacterium]
MRVPVLLPHHDVERIACPTCRATGTVRIAGHPGRQHGLRTGPPLTTA